MVHLRLITRRKRVRNSDWGVPLSIKCYEGSFEVCPVRIIFTSTWASVCYEAGICVRNHLQKLAGCARRMLAKKGNFHYNGERISQIKWLRRIMNRFSRCAHFTLRRSVLKPVRNRFILVENPQQRLDTASQNGSIAKDGWMRRENSLLNDISRWCSCSGMPRGSVNRIRIWPLRRDDRSGVLIGAGGTRRSD